MIGVLLRRRAVSKAVRSHAAAAVPHPWNQEETIELLRAAGCLLPRVREFVQKRADAVVVSNRAERRNRGIAPTVILDEFASIRAEASEIRIRRIQNWPRLLIAERDISVEVQVSVIPFRILKDCMAVVGASETVLNR